MRKKLTKVVAVLLLVLMLGTVPGLVACGDGDGPVATNKIVMGWDWDFTGRASTAVKQMYEGFTDYLRMTKEEAPVPGVVVEPLVYDGKSDPARVLQGYHWLKDRGTEIFTCAPHDYAMLRDRIEADNMLCFLTSTQLVNLDSPNLVSQFGTPESELEIVMQWIMDTWTETRPAKIGFVGLAGIAFYEAQLEQVLDMVEANPDKLEISSVQMVPTTTKTWAAEIQKLMPSDYINVAMSGSFLATFTIEARQRGYEKELVGPLESWWGFWDLVKGVVPEADLDGVVTATYFQWWNEPGTFVDEANTYLDLYRPDEAAHYRLVSGWLSGWGYGYIMIDALRRAADKVGGENVTDADLFQALQETDLTVDGWTTPWKTTPTVNALMRGVKMMQYQAAVADWVQIEPYVIPPSLGG